MYQELIHGQLCSTICANQPLLTLMIGYRRMFAMRDSAILKPFSEITTGRSLRNTSGKLYAAYHQHLKSHLKSHLSRRRKAAKTQAIKTKRTPSKMLKVLF